MKPSKFYKYLSITLLCINLFLIGLLVIPKPPFGERNPTRALKNAQLMMQLDGQQHEMFLQLAQHHGQFMDSLNHQQRELLSQYFGQLTNQSIATNTDSILSQLEQIERQKITSTYQHFEEVRDILRPGQEQGFEEFVRRTLRVILAEPPTNPLPPK